MVAGCTSSFYLAARCSDHWLYPDGSWMSTQWTRLGADRFFIMAEWWKFACFLFGFYLPWDENHPPITKHCLGEYVLGHFSDHPRSKSRLKMFERWPGGQQLNLLNIMLFLFSIEPCVTRESICWNGPKSAPQVWTWQDDDVYPCLSFCCWMMFSQFPWAI